MDAFEFNKIAGAVLATALGVMVLSILSEIIYTPAEPEAPAYEIVVAEPEPAEPAEDVAAEDAAGSIAVLLAGADAAAGEKAAKKCVACHNFTKGAKAKVGPALYGVVGGPIAAASGFKYSAALTEKGQDGSLWTFEALEAFLATPKAAVPGTAMAFAGLKKEVDRANVIAYLNAQSDAPLPLPQAPAEAAEIEPEAEGADAMGPDAMADGKSAETPTEAPDGEPAE